MLPSKGKGKIAAIILARMKDKEKPSKPEYEEDEEKGSSDPGMESAMESFAKALRAEDYAGMAQALCEFLHCHEASEESDPGHED